MAKASSDPTLDSLKRILDSGEYEVIPGVPVFDEHDEYDEKGKLVRKFDRKKLQEICEATNRREEETGDLAPFGPGHTIDGAPETMQPPVWGFFRNFRVGTFGPQKKQAILADKLVHKDRKTDAGTYPRRSIELWTKDNIIDWVALLRRTPERDLGMLAYSRDAGVHLPPGRGATLYYDATKHRPAAAQLSPAGKLRYSMEAHSVSDTNQTQAEQQNTGCDPTFEQFCKMMDRYMAQHHAKYAAGFPGVGGVAIPGHAAAAPAPAMDEEKVRLQREAELIRFSRMEQQLAQLQAQAARAECEAQVKSLIYEGYELDVAAEVDHFARLDNKGRADRCDYIRRYYRKDPTGGPWVQLQADAANKPRETTVEERNRAVSYASKNGCGYDEALLKTRAGA